MIDRAELLQVLRGVRLILRFDARAVAHFPPTRDSALRSFAAAILALPMHAAFVAERLARLPDDGSLGRALLVEAIGYVVAWAMFPILADIFASSIDREPQFPRMVTAYNWLALAHAAIQISVMLVDRVSEAAALALGVVVLGYLLATIAFAIRQVFDTGWGLAAGLTLADFVLGMTLHRTIRVLEVM
jgi:hypothetical protein